MNLESYVSPFSHEDDSNLQSYTKYLRQTLDFTWIKALWENFNFYFSIIFCEYWLNLRFSGNTGHSQYEVFKLSRYFLFSQDHKILVVQQLVLQESYTIIISSNHAPSHLWRNKSLVKYQKVSKYYEHDCSLNLVNNLTPLI